MSKCEVDRPAKSSTVVLKSERNAQVDSEIILNFFSISFQARKLEGLQDIYPIKIRMNGEWNRRAYELKREAKAFVKRLN